MNLKKTYRNNRVKELVVIKSYKRKKTHLSDRNRNDLKFSVCSFQDSINEKRQRIDGVCYANMV